MRIFLTGALASILFAATQAVAGAAPSGKPSVDYWAEVVCKKEEVLGSRLAMKKTCLTRLQWAEQERQNRDQVLKLQTEGCTVSRSASGSSPSC